MSGETDPYLQSTFFIDTDHPDVIAFTRRVCTGIGDRDLKTKAIRLYYAVRDEIRYDPYDLSDRAVALKASSVIRKGAGYCVAKAVALAAVARQQGIPARLGFADVRNHLSTARLRALMGTDVFYFHGYTELLLDNRWVKATPAFNLALCRRFGVKPLDFDGEHDSIFHEHNEAGEKHMQYVNDRGQYPDLPFAELFAVYRHHYPRMFDLFSARRRGDFHTEAINEQKPR